MNNTDQPQYYPNPAATHVQPTSFYMPNTGMEQRKIKPIKKSNHFFFFFF